MIPTILRTPLRYYGAKWLLAPWILAHFPDHTCYAEPFGGAGGVLLRKTPAEVEVYNDLDGGVVNFFRVLRECPNELIRLIQGTPWSRHELELSFDLQTDNPLENARRFYVRSWQARGGPRPERKAGWRFERDDKRGKHYVADWNGTEHLYAIAARLKVVQIECAPALDVIQRFDAPNTLFYCDPPYLAQSRNKRWSRLAYKFEMSEDEHRALAGALTNIRGMAIVSHYPHPLYDEIYRDWLCFRTTALTEAKTEATECIYLSPRAAQRAKQMYLFAL